jgi:hypothetical protein
LAFCSPVARRFGPWRFLAFMVATAAAGAAAHLVTHYGELLPMVGASASISGAMAAAMRFAFQRGGPIGLWRDNDDAYRVPALSLLGSLRDPRVLAFLVVWFGSRSPGRHISAASWRGCSDSRSSIRCRGRLVTAPIQAPDRPRRFINRCAGSRLSRLGL